MTKAPEHVSVEVAHKRFKSLVLYAALAFFVSLVVGGVGGWFVWQNAGSGGVPRILLFAPGLVCVVATCIPIRVLKNRWFECDEAIQAAAKKEPWPPTPTSEESGPSEAA